MHKYCVTLYNEAFPVLVLTVLNNPLSVLVVLPVCHRLHQVIHRPMIFLLVHFPVMSYTRQQQLYQNKYLCHYYCNAPHRGLQ